MFTGLIQQVGSVNGFESVSGGKRLFVCSSEWSPSLQLGESVAVNGVCLTVCAFKNGCYVFDVLQETLDKSTLGGKNKGDPVNLERALAANGTIGGHIVTGHVDGIGCLVARRTVGRDLLLRVACDEVLLNGMVLKGSVACDGASLTISAISHSVSFFDGIKHAGFFETQLVPHTRANTMLDQLREGDRVNVETDVIGKYVFKRMSLSMSDSSITMERLREAGF